MTERRMGLEWASWGMDHSIVAQFCILLLEVSTVAHHWKQANGLERRSLDRPTAARWNCG